ncbi:hypothetical protein ABK040_006059 [Willaertia magna]
MNINYHHNNKTINNNNTQLIEKVYTIPNNLVKYIIGPQGKHIRGIEELSGCKASIIEQKSQLQQQQLQNNNLAKLTIKGQTQIEIENAWNAIKSLLLEYGWKFNEKQNNFFELLSEAQQLFSELEKKIEQEANEMANCFEESKKAYNKGNGALAKHKSEEGKKHQQQMQLYQKESAQKMFQYINSGNDITIIDLHGQYTNFALEFLKERVELFRKKNIKKELQIIVGAGNHSGKHGAKIKPLVINYLINEKISYKETNLGQLSAQF